MQNTGHTHQKALIYKDFHETFKPEGTFVSSRSIRIVGLNYAAKFPPFGKDQEEAKALEQTRCNIRIAQSISSAPSQGLKTGLPRMRERYDLI